MYILSRKIMETGSAKKNVREYSLRGKDEKSKKVPRKYTKTYHCAVCNEIYMNKASFENHNLIHNSDKPFACLYCDYRSALRDIMRNHINIQHGILMNRTDIFTEDLLDVVARNKFKCTICTQQFSSKSILLQHHLINKGCKPFRCLHCEKINSKGQENDLTIALIDNINYRFTNGVNEPTLLIENPLISNRTIKEEDLTDEIENCDIDNPTNLLTQESAFDELDGNPLELKNEDCIYELAELYDIEDTTYEETDNKRKSDQIYKCKICNQQFLDKAALQNHSVSHCGSKPFGCPHCDYRSTLRGIMKNHIEVRHGISMKINNIVADRKHKLYTKAFLCKFCSKIFASKQGLLNHRAHNNKCKPYKCCDCEYRCIMKTTMKRHIVGRHGKNINCGNIHPCKTIVTVFRQKENVENNTNNHSSSTDIKLEIDTTTILPEFSIKEEKMDDTDEMEKIETKYAIDLGATFNENQINSFENDHLHYTLKCIPGDEILVDIKEEIVTES